MEGWKFSQAMLKPTPSPTATVERSSVATARWACAPTANRKRRLSAIRRFMLPVAERPRPLGLAFFNRAINEGALLLFQRVEQLAHLFLRHLPLLLCLTGLGLFLRLSLLRLLLFLVAL